MLSWACREQHRKRASQKEKPHIRSQSEGSGKASIETSFGKANKKYKPGWAFKSLPLDLDTKSDKELSTTDVDFRHIAYPALEGCQSSPRIGFWSMGRSHSICGEKLQPAGKLPTWIFLILLMSVNLIPGWDRKLAYFSNVRNKYEIDIKIH